MLLKEINVDDLLVESEFAWQDRESEVRRGSTLQPYLTDNELNGSG